MDAEVDQWITRPDDWACKSLRTYLAQGKQDTVKRDIVDIKASFDGHLVRRQ